MNDAPDAIATARLDENPLDLGRGLLVEGAEDRVEVDPARWLDRVVADRRQATRVPDTLRTLMTTRASCGQQPSLFEPLIVRLARVGLPYRARRPAEPAGLNRDPVTG